MRECLYASREVSLPAGPEAGLVVGTELLSLGAVGPGLHLALQALVRGGETEDALLDMAGADGAVEAARLCRLLTILRQGGHLHTGLATESDLICIWEPGSGSHPHDGPASGLVGLRAHGGPSRGFDGPSPGFDGPSRGFDGPSRGFDGPSPGFAGPPGPDGPPLQLSRFACLRCEGGCLVLESALSDGRLRLVDARAVAMVTGFSRPLRAAEVVAGQPDLEEALVLKLLAWMQEMGALVGDPQAPGTWEFHDLLFHSRSRPARLPASKQWVQPGPRPGGSELALPEAVPLTMRFDQVLHGRRSRRRQGQSPITLAQLGAFLAHSARDYDGLRPYPSGGGIYELEIYLAVSQCQGLEAGLYHYCPVAHGLSRRSPPTPAVTALLTQAADSTLRSEPPQVLVLVASRHAVRSQKYRSLAYSLTLKGVGALLQTMCLVAGALDLAACAVGWSNPDLFARASCLDRFDEPSVGELILGSRAPS